MTEHLWAPWRMDFILGKKHAGCIFCDLPAEGPARYRENLILLRTEHAFVILNRYPFNAGHVMVVPTRHVSDPAELDDAAYDALMRLVRASVARVRAATNADGINVGMNLGKVAGAGIAEHMHVHLVPRWVGDQNFMPVIADTRVMPEHLDATYARLAPHFADLVTTPRERAP